MSNYSPPNFEFADDSPIQKGRKHRRGRGHATKSSSSSNSRSNGGPSSPSLSAQLTGSKNTQTQYFSADWDNVNISLNSRNNDDHNSCAGSLTYSASSSVQSGMSSGGESSNDSSFADIIKLIDSEGEGSSEVKAFMSARSEAASEFGGTTASVRDGGSAVAGWMQRVDARAKQQQQQKKQQQQQHNSSGRGRNSNAANVALNYSRDDSNDEDVKLETITG